MRIRYYLKHPDRESLLSVRYRHRGIAYQFSTGLRIDPKTWDGRRISVRRDTNITLNNNRYLDRVETALVEAHSELLASDRLTLANLKELFLLKSGQKKPQSQYLIDFLDKIIAERKASGMYKPGSVKVLETARKKLYDYESYRGSHHTFDEITPGDFLAGFLDFMDGFKKNYINKVVSILKMSMDIALDREYHSNRKHQSKNFRVPQEKVFNIYLDEDELMKIYYLDLTDSPGRERTRDLFIIASYTGLRYSDVSRLRREQILNDQIRVKTVKTAQQLVIPLSPLVRIILQKYDYQPPQAVANQRMNVQLKEICERANIDTPVMKDGTVYKKFDLVSSHTARRSFATNAYKRNVPTLAIMAITGHTTEKSFMKYIKITPEQYAELMAKNPFFSMMRAK